MFCYRQRAWRIIIKPKLILTQTKEEIREKGYDIFITHEKIDGGGMAYTVEAGKVNELCEFIDKKLDTLAERYAERMNMNVGMLRQWLNEDRIKDADKFVTNEELEHWLGLKGKLTEDK